MTCTMSVLIGPAQSWVQQWWGRKQEAAEPPVLLLAMLSIP